MKSKLMTIIIYYLTDNTILESSGEEASQNRDYTHTRKGDVKS